MMDTPWETPDCEEVVTDGIHVKNIKYFSYFPLLENNTQVYTAALIKTAINWKDTNVLEDLKLLLSSN